MRDHTGERPFRWNKWMKNFKEARSLRSHMKMHVKDDDSASTIDAKEAIYPIPQYKEMDLKGNLISTMISEDLNKAHKIENLVNQNSYQFASWTNNSEAWGEWKSTPFYEITYSLPNLSVGNAYETYWVGHSPLILPFSEYFERVQGMYTSLPQNSNFISSAQLESSRRNALDHLSSQIMNNFI